MSKKNTTDKTFFDLKAIKSHLDVLRSKHRATAFIFDKTITTQAQTWATHLSQTNTFSHSGCKYGENIAMVGSSAPIIDATKQVVESIDLWYKEISNYDYNKPGFSSNTGHFTSLVWKKSSHVGIGVAVKGTTCYVVMNFDPPGNLQGDFPTNVLEQSTLSK